MSAVAQFSCSACGRKYAWKSELSGKKVRCKCGEAVAVPTATRAMSAPASAPLPVMAMREPSPPARPVVAAADPHDAPDLDNLYALAGDDDKIQQAAAEAGGLRCPSCSSEAEPGALICLSCGMNFQTGKKMNTAIGLADDVPAKPKKTRGTVFNGAAPEAGGGGRVLGYAGNNPRAAAAAAKDQAEGLKALMWPIIFVALGFVASMTNYMVGAKLSFGQASAWLTIGTAVDMVLLFIACLVAIKLMDISLGAPSEAALKLCAVALVPGAIGGLISHSFEGGALIGWAVSYGLYLALLMWFFDLDGSEVMMLSTIIWLIRTWVGMAVTGFLMAAIFGMAGAGGGGGGGGAVAPQSAVTTSLFGGSNLVTDQTPAGRENLRAEVMLKRDGSEKADAFLKRTKLHHFRSFSPEESPDVLEGLEEAGAINIFVSDVKTFSNGEVVADKLVVELPVDTEARAELFAIHKDRLAGMDIDLIDHGPKQGYMILDFDGNKDY